MSWYPQRRPHRADASESDPQVKGAPRPFLRRRLLFEDLEDRRLMSVGATDAPFSATGKDLNAIAGVPFQAPLATINDSDPGGTNYGLSVDWGDGQVSTSASFAALPDSQGLAAIGTHVYEKPGTYDVHVTINDSGGPSAWVNDRATVADAPAPATEGQPFNGPVATFTPTSSRLSAGDLQAEIRWEGAQGKTTTPGTVAPDGHGGFIISGQHTFTQVGKATPQVTVRSTPSGPPGAFPPAPTPVADLTGQVRVADAPLSASAPPLAATAGQAVSGVVAHVVDSNPAGAIGDLHASIDWGDGSSSDGTLAPDPLPADGGTPGNRFQVTGSHTYVKPGAYDLRVQITDQGGATTSAGGQATVAAAPTSAPTPTTPTTPATPSGPATGPSPGSGLPDWFSSWRWFWTGWDRSKTWVAQGNNPAPGAPDTSIS